MDDKVRWRMARGNYSGGGSLLNFGAYGIPRESKRRRGKEVPPPKPEIGIIKGFTLRKKAPALLIKGVLSKVEALEKAKEVISAKEVRSFAVVVKPSTKKSKVERVIAPAPCKR
jgi:hypothetical protein